MGVLLEPIEAGLGDGVAIEIVEQIDDDDQRKEPSVNLSDKLLLCFSGKLWRI